MCGGPRPAEAEALAEIIQAEWIRERGAVAASASGVVCLDDLIADPAGDEETEDAVFMGQRNENSEDDKVNNALGELSVVHGSDARDDAE
jgi:hypothetical protein